MMVIKFKNGELQTIEASDLGDLGCKSYSMVIDDPEIVSIEFTEDNSRQRPPAWGGCTIEDKEGI